MTDVLQPAAKPAGYAPPTYARVREIHEVLRRTREPVLYKIGEVKKIRRGEWREVIQRIPETYRKMLINPDLPQVRDMIQRLSGLVAKNPPKPQVLPPSTRDTEVRKAAREEQALSALRIAIEDQQDRPIFEMGIDAQIAWGESWIAVMPDATRMDGDDWKRGKDEEPRAYTDRAKRLMARGGVPIVLEDFDPQTVFPFVGDRQRLAIVIVETEHTALEVELGMGYKAIRNEDGKTDGWIDMKANTLSEGYVLPADRGNAQIGVVNRDLGFGNTDGSRADTPVKKLMYFDGWTYQCYLDGVLVEQWEHDYGIVPIFPAFGETSSDRDPGWASAGVADAAITIAKHLVLFAAVLQSSALQHGFPTGFIRNPVSNLVDHLGNPLVREIHFGKLNVMGMGEEIEFPFLNARVNDDFIRYLDYLNTQLEAATLSNFGRALGSDISGYSIAQIRAMQLSILSTIISGARRQWRGIFQMFRHIIKTDLPAGVYLPGAVMEDDDGTQYRPIVELRKSDITEFAIEVDIDDSIPQDEVAMGKYAAEMMQAGVWSKRRTQEQTGVENPWEENIEINHDRLVASPAADEATMKLVNALLGERFNAMQQEQASPLDQAIEQAKGTVLGGPGQMQNQGATPMNSGAGGLPLNQQGSSPNPGGGQSINGPPLDSLGIRKQPGGVAGVEQTPVGAF